jgi:hypothetical protein
VEDPVELARELAVAVAHEKPRMGVLVVRTLGQVLGTHSVTDAVRAARSLAKVQLGDADFFDLGLSPLFNSLPTSGLTRRDLSSTTQVWPNGSRKQRLPIGIVVTDVAMSSMLASRLLGSP